MLTIQKAANASRSCLPWPVKPSSCPTPTMLTGIDEFDRFLGGLPNYSVTTILTSKADKIWALEVSQKIVETNAEYLFGNDEPGIHLASFQKPLDINEISSLRNLTSENNCCAIFIHEIEHRKKLIPGMNLGTSPLAAFAPIIGDTNLQALAGIVPYVDLILTVDEFREARTTMEHDTRRDGMPDPNGKTLRLNLIKNFGEEVRHFFVKKSDL